MNACIALIVLWIGHTPNAVYGKFTECPPWPPDECVMIANLYWTEYEGTNLEVVCTMKGRLSKWHGKMTLNLDT